MVSQIAPTSNCHGCKITDGAPPPAPQIRVIAASAGLCEPGTAFYPNSPPTPAPHARDPAYIEIGNWEPGTKIQILNKSNDPRASFDKPSDVVTLEPTGRDIDSRIASVWMTQKDMDKINLDAGDSLWIRVIDDEGNASPAVKSRLAGANYGTPGRAMENNALLPAGRLNLLDGEAEWKNNMILKYIADQKAPVANHFEKELKLQAGENGAVTLVSSGTLEEGARVRIQNGRTGAQHQGVVNADQALSMPLGTDVKDGDSFFLTVSDQAGNAADKFEVRYGAGCKDGRAPTKGILGAKLKSVIK